MTHLHGDEGWQAHIGQDAVRQSMMRPMSDWTKVEHDLAGHFSTAIREEQDRSRKRSYWSWYKQRYADLMAIIRERIAPEDTIPETDDAFYLIRVMGYHLQAVHGPDHLVQALDEWCVQMAPWARYAVSDVILEVVHDVEGRRRDLTAIRAGLEVGLRWEERVRLSIRTIRPIDLTAAEFRQKARERKQKADRDREAARRRLAGVPDREAWLEENSASRTKPWLEMGVSRRTYYRRLASERRGTGPSQLGEAYKTCEQPVPTAAVSSSEASVSAEDEGAAVAPVLNPTTKSIFAASTQTQTRKVGVSRRGGRAFDDALKPLGLPMDQCHIERTAA